ncbi:MAG: hypothetical protein PHQ59_03005 [Candidatus Daviesbacteria bacterium]|nr:hypothetical protein [Candidatus Daviesbacteria bacterium]
MLTLKSVISNKFNFILILIVLLLLGGGFFAYQKFVASRAQEQVLEEVDLAFDAEGPYAILYPRRDGNALVLNLKRTGSYDKISYDLAYVSDNGDNTEAGSDGASAGIDRGVSGDINTKDKKGEYEQEILFGTCSKNICKYDTGVENGTLTLHIQKGNKAYRMITQWHIQKPDVALGKLTSGDTHLVYQIDKSSANELSLTSYSIINDLSGAPKLPSDKQVMGKVYAVNVPVAKIMPPGSITIELAEAPPQDAKITRFDETSGKWIEMDTKINGSTLTASSDSAGVITVLSSKK